MRPLPPTMAVEAGRRGHPHTLRIQLPPLPSAGPIARCGSCLAFLLPCNAGIATISIRLGLLPGFAADKSSRLSGGFGLVFLGSVMTLQLNGEQREVPDGLSLAGLVEWLELPADRVAIERNLEVIKRANWNETRLENGDRLEIVRMVGGGRPTGPCRGDYPCLPL